MPYIIFLKKYHDNILERLCLAWLTTFFSVDTNLWQFIPIEMIEELVSYYKEASCTWNYNIDDNDNNNNNTNNDNINNDNDNNNNDNSNDNNDYDNGDNLTLIWR